MWRTPSVCAQRLHSLPSLRSNTGRYFGVHDGLHELSSKSSSNQDRLVDSFVIAGALPIMIRTLALAAPERALAEALPRLPASLAGMDIDFHCQGLHRLGRQSLCLEGGERMCLPAG